MNPITHLLLAACILLPAGVQAAGAKKKAAAKAPADTDAQSDELKASSASGVDKKRFESYLKDRLSKINDHHKARMDFMAQENDTWNSFWSKVRDERKIFEIRITRQTLDLFESLASLDAHDQPVTIADFEKMQANVIKSFEMQQKQKMAEFFTARDARFREFAGGQEKEREEFVAEAAMDWQHSKADLKNPGGAAGDEAAAPAEEEEAPKPVKKAKVASASKPKPKVKLDDGSGWH